MGAVANDYSILTLALSSGVMGALIALAGQSLKNWWNQPVLSIRFDRDEHGCEVETKGAVTFTNIVGQTVTPYSVASSENRFLRIKLLNRGRTSAQNVTVSITRLSFRAPGTGEKDFSEEIFDLKLAGTEQTAFNLARSGHRFVDLLHTSVFTPVNGQVMVELDKPQEGCQARRYFDVQPSGWRLEDLGMTKGDYRVALLVTADNTDY